MIWRMRLTFFLTASLAWTAAFAQAGSARGTLFIVGGGPQPPELVRHFVDLAGGAGHARIVVFAMASEEGLSSGEEKAADLRALGADARNLWIDREQANSDSVVRIIEQASGIWFGGGDQARLTRVLRGTRAERAMHARYESGAVIGGTSAGAAVMSQVMITGDERHPGGDRPDTTEAFITIARDNVVTDSGFAFLTNAVIDQHFLRRKRLNRLISVVLEREPHLGIGIDESTAMVVHPDGRWSVEGASAATIFDARHAAVTSAAAHTLGATGVIMHVLPAGSTYDPSTGITHVP
jgi:cyanophycinase